ncbi:MAG: hypothetical protein JRF49_12240, partial [Deltaproteobacteria bacterium]|nr:hypothetical protein [Deltaproteobacteria bacterium]
MKKLSIVYASLLIVSFMACSLSAQECIVDEECYDNLWCTGSERCINSQCVEGTLPCDDGNACTVEICEEAAAPGETTPGTCSSECAVVSTADPCCNDPVCIQSPICTAQVTITPDGVQAFPGDVGVKVNLCLDNYYYAVGAVQVDVCEEYDGSPIDCLLCEGCELTERT